MTKKDALFEFKCFVLPSIIQRYGELDKVAIREAWGNWTDSLCKEGKITMTQYQKWVNPY